jgi:hypothetical protein
MKLITNLDLFTTSTLPGQYLAKTSRIPDVQLLFINGSKDLSIRLLQLTKKLLAYASSGKDVLWFIKLEQALQSDSLNYYFSGCGIRTRILPNQTESSNLRFLVLQIESTIRIFWKRSTNSIREKTLRFGLAKPDSRVRRPGFVRIWDLQILIFKDSWRFVRIHWIHENRLILWKLTRFVINNSKQIF